MDELNRVEAEALAAIGGGQTLSALEEIDTAFLGRKAGKLTGLLRSIGTLPPEQKPGFGQALNEAKTRVEAALADRKAEVSRLERANRERAEALDVTLPGRAPVMGRLHPLTTTMDQVKQTLIGLGFEFRDSTDIQNYRYNFDWLNYPPDHPAMDEQDSFYVDDDHLLRTQTTALQGHVFESRLPPPFRIATSGRCFRNDDLDDTHSHTFHQVDGFSVAEGISLADLKGTLAAFFRGIFGPDAVVRFRPDYFPFVEPGVEVAVKWSDPHTGAVRWLEMGGAGLIHPNILHRAGLDTERYTGFAFGLGIDRMPMRRLGVDNVRLFLENDLRFLQQF